MQLLGTPSFQGGVLCRAAGRSEVRSWRSHSREAEDAETLERKASLHTYQIFFPNRKDHRSKGLSEVESAISRTMAPSPLRMLDVSAAFSTAFVGGAAPRNVYAR